GAPQGGVCSPILSNIYLDKLDKFVETELLPKYNREKRRQKNPAYQSIEHALARAKRKGDRQAVRALRQQRRKLSSQDPQDPTYRRLRYVRYADDWALGFSGPKAEAEEIKRDIRTFLRDTQDRKSTRLNSSHGSISYAVFCLKKKTRRLQPSTHHT